VNALRIDCVTRPSACDTAHGSAAATDTPGDSPERRPCPSSPPAGALPVRQNVGVTQVGERIWLVTFMQYDLGYFDDEVGRLEPIANPFGPKVLPMCSE
jgi:hypothetical protein